MGVFRDFRALVLHYITLFGFQGMFFFVDKLVRRSFPLVLYRYIQRSLWPTKEWLQKIKVGKPAIEDGKYRHSMCFIHYLPDPYWFVSHFPYVLRKKISAADCICNHVFNFLGTGDTCWGDPIDWHRDVKSGYRWPTRFYTELMPVFNTTDTTDGKIPYELSRFHHFVTLGQAWWLTDEERYADEFFVQWENWLTVNSWLYGINWTCAMEVAIRAVNLLWAVILLAESPGWTSDRSSRLYRSLWQHGVYIEHNLEVGVSNGQIVTANHYLANVCGLACIGLFCPELPSASRWRRVGLRALEQEIRRQVLSDGFFFESSTSYHRLALELFLVPALIAKRCGYKLSSEYWARLERMLDVVLYLTRPDGCVPQIGDNDDGRLLILSGYPDWPRHDYRYLLALGAVLFKRGDFKAAAGKCAEEVFWLMGRQGVEVFDALKSDVSPLQSRAFTDGGLYIIRSQDGRDYALVRAGGPASHAPTAHAHNDALSLELWLDGLPIVVDPGTYCYTSDLTQRNHFRSTMMHNTVTVGGQEINRIPHNEIFRLEKDAEIHVLEWYVNSKEVRLVAEHNGYAQLHPPVVHRRMVRYLPAERKWEVEDRLLSEGSHPAKLQLHFAPETSVSLDSQKLYIDHKVCIEWRGVSDVRLCSDFVAPSYGCKLESLSLELSCDAANPTVVCFSVMHADGTECHFRQ